MNRLIIPERHLIGAFECKKSYKNHINTKNIYSLKHDKKQWLTLNGTSSAKDWIYNLDIVLTDEGEHNGFRKYANDCLKEFNLKNIFDSDIENLLLCGHSLGAVGCTMLCYDIMKNNMNKNNIKIELILFGSPKPGGKKFKNNFNQLKKYNNVDIYRYLNGNDIVEDFPQLIEYEHISDPIILNTDIKNSVQNHHISSYIDNILSKK